MSTNMVSGGRNVNTELCCGFPTCKHLIPSSNRDGGWCSLPENKVPPCREWPKGFIPSVSSSGGCDKHEV